MATEIILRLKPVASEFDTNATPLSPPVEGVAVTVATLSEAQADRAMVTMLWLDDNDDEVAATNENHAAVSMAAVRSPGGLGPFVFPDSEEALYPGKPVTLGRITPGTWSAIVREWNPPVGATKCAIVLWGWD